MLPAYAGMIPEAQIKAQKKYGAPRVCGDDPVISNLASWAGKCSPRMRG